MDLAAAPITLTEPEQLKMARRLIRAQVGHAGASEQAADDIELMASELITNGLIHGTGPVHVTLAFLDDVVWVEVHDDGPGFSVAAQRHHGRGSAIVEALSVSSGRKTDGTYFFEAKLNP